MSNNQTPIGYNVRHHLIGTDDEIINQQQINMRGLKITLIVLIALMTMLFITYVYLSIVNTNHYNSYLNKSIVFKGDTLTIINYSEWNNVYIMDDGRALNMQLVHKLDTINK